MPTQLAEVLFLPRLSLLATTNISSFRRQTIVITISLFFREAVSLSPSLSFSLCGCSGNLLIMTWIRSDCQCSRECGAPYLFLHALLHPAIRWRTHEFRLQWGGRAEPVVGKVGGKQNEDVTAIKLTGSENSDLELASSRLIS